MKHAQISPDRLALSTDLYELTMAAAYFTEGIHERTATFDLNVRHLPANRGYLLVAGLEQALAYLRDLHFTKPALDYLADTGHFQADFLDHLAELRFTGSVHALPEGTVAFPPEPLLRVTAPIIEAQIVETFLLTMLTFQTMIATKAARIVQAAAGRHVVDFSPRRDHGPQAGLLAARASFIGGCIGTSNVLAGAHFGLPTYGTMAHSYIMSHESEADAFAAFSASYPGDPTLLIDTYDTLQGAKRAVETAKLLAGEGRELAAVRLDSGDLVALSRKVRSLLDDAGLESTRIFASGGLDEYEIDRLVTRGARIDAFGVGTELGTSGDAPSLDSTYKLVACADEHGDEIPVIKLSSGKSTLPGRKQVWRHHRENRFTGDLIALEDQPPTTIARDAEVDADPLLVPAMLDGEVVAELPSLEQLQRRAAAQLAALPDDVTALRDAGAYPVDLAPELLELAATLRDR